MKILWNNYKKDIFLLSSVLLILSLYFLINMHYFTPVLFWFSTYSELLEQGKVIYRDFYTPLPPLYVYIIHWIHPIFEDCYFLYRIYGIVERLVLVSIIYWTYRQFIDQKWSFVITLFSGFMITSCFFESLANEYTFFCITCLLISGLLFLRMQKYESYASIILSALFLAIGINLKHSIGVPVLGCMSFFLLLFKPQKIKHGKTIVIWLSTLVITLVVLISPVIYHGVWNEFLSSVFYIGSTSSKGSISQIMFKTILRFNLVTYLSTLFILFVTIFFSMFRLQITNSIYKRCTDFVCRKYILTLGCIA